MRKKNLLLLFVFILLISSSIILSTPSYYHKEKSKGKSFSTTGWDDGGCAGLVATGSVVKDGRSIHWKNRHTSSSTDNFVEWHQGTKYSYFIITDDTHHGRGYQGMNEEGLSIGNLVCAQNPLQNITGYTSGVNNLDASDVIPIALGNCSTVKEAIDVILEYSSGGSSGTQFHIISSEPGVGAIVAIDDATGSAKPYNITWINNTWCALANAFYCDGDHDSDGNDLRVAEIIQDIRNNSTSSDGDNLINWKDVIQRCAKDVNNKEEGSGTFSYAGEISKGTTPCAIVSISGNNSFGNATSMAWVAIGRQPLINEFYPVSPVYMDSADDVPIKLSRKSYEDKVDVKHNYATSGVDSYYCDRVREILTYANSNENYSFERYDNWFNSLTSDMTEEQVKSSLKQMCDKDIGIMSYNYEHNLTYNAEDTDLSHYLYSKKIVIDHTKVDATLTNFTVLIHNISSDFSNHAQPDGDDFLFMNSDNSSKLYHEIEKYDNTTGELWAWVKIPILSSTEDTTLWLYYGNSDCGSQQTPSEVWDSDYLVVQHYTDILKDSTKNGYDSDDSDGSIVDYGNSGKIADCVEVDEDTLDTTIKINNWATLSSEFTAEMWIYIDGTETSESYPRVFTEGGGYTINDWCLYLRPGNPDNEIRVTMNNATEVTSGNLPGSNGKDLWFYIAIGYNGSADKIVVFTNDTKQIDYTTTTTLEDNYDYLTIANDGGGGNTWDGYIDEMRVSRIRRSDSWINTAFNNQNNPDSFITVGNENFNWSNNWEVTGIPSSLNKSEYLEITINSETYTGKIDICFGFNDSNISPTWKYIQKEAWGYKNITNVSSYDDLGIENYDDFSVDYGSKNNTQLYRFNYTLDNGTSMSMICAFTSYTQYGNDYNLSGNYYYWDLWTDENTVDYNYSNMTKWYLAKNLSISEGTSKKVKIYIKCYISNPFNSTTVSGKYWFLIKPSNETLSDSINNTHYYSIDPFYTIKTGITSNYGTYLPTTSHIAIDSNGKIHTVFMDSNRDVWYANSTDNGQTWNPQLIEDHSDPIESTAIVVDNADRIHIVYSTVNRPYTGYLRYVNSTDGGSSFGTISNIQSNGWVSPRKPAIAVDSNDVLHVAYENGGRCRYRKSTDHGHTWSSQLLIGSSAQDSKSPSIVIDDSDTIHIIDKEEIGGGYNIYYRKSTNGGSSFSGLTRLTSNGVSYPDICVDSNGHLHIVCYKSDTHQINYMNSTNNGSSWSSLVAITSEPSPYRQDYGVSISADNNNVIHIVWSGNYSGMDTKQIRYTNSSSNFNNIVNLTTSTSGHKYHPALYFVNHPSGLNINGYEFIYTDLSENKVKFYTTASAGGTFTPQEPSTFTATAVSTSQINLTWTKSTGADTTYIERNTTETWNRGEGVEVYNNTGTSYSDTGLNDGTTYYYQAWSYNITDKTYSSSYKSANATTFPITTPVVVTNESSGVEETNATLNGYLQTDGNDTTHAWFEWGKTTNYGNRTYYNPIYDNSDGTIEGGEKLVGTASGYRMSVETKLYSPIDIEVDGIAVNIYSTVGSYYGFTVDIYIAEEAPDLTPEEGIKVKDDWTPDWSSGLQYISFDTSYTLKKDTTYSINFVTSSKSGNNNYLTISISVGGGSYRILYYGSGNSDMSRWADISFYHAFGLQSGQEFSYNLSNLLPGTIYHYRAVANNSNSTVYGSDKTFLTKPLQPTSFSAVAYNDTQINLTWTKGTGANYTYIERNATGQTTWNMGEGILVYNGTGTSYSDTGLNPSTTYYYQAWSYTEWDTLNQWSDEYASDSAKTENVLDISVIPSSIDFGDVNVSESAQTNNYYFNLSNQGSMCNVWVTVGDSQNWTFVNYSGWGHDKFCMNWSDDNWVSENNFKEGGCYIKTNLDSWYLFDLKVLTPKTISHLSDGEAWVITFTAEAIP